MDKYMAQVCEINEEKGEIILPEKIINASKKSLEEMLKYA